jgi:hypothetical protein
MRLSSLCGLHGDDTEQVQNGTLLIGTVTKRYMQQKGTLLNGMLQKSAL